MIRQTSIDTYSRIKNEGLIGKLQFEVYNIIYEHGPVTQTEVVHYSGRLNSPQSITPRFAELVEKGIIAAAPNRICRIKGNDVMTWVTTDDLPKKIKSKGKKLTAQEENEECAKIVESTGDLLLAYKLRSRYLDA